MPASPATVDQSQISAWVEQFHRDGFLFLDCHVVHNNSFKTPHGGGLTTWHQDDAPHYLVTEGDAPTNVRLPVLFFTANYYLTDVTEIAHGCTEAIPGSHLFGKPSPEVMAGTEWESQIKYNLGKAGSVVLFNNQVWHRGGPNTSDRTRYITHAGDLRSADDRP